MQIIKYDGTSEERERIIFEKIALGFTLIEVSNIIEGNFLGFIETSMTTQPNEPTNSKIAQMISDLQADLIIAGVI